MARRIRPNNIHGNSIHRMVRRITLSSFYKTTTKYKTTTHIDTISKIQHKTIISHYILNKTISIMFFVLFVFINLIVTCTSTQNKQVVTFVASWCDDSCNTWIEWTDKLALKYPNVSFKTIDADSELALAYNISKQKYNDVQDEYIEVPTSIFIENEQHHPFIGSRTFNGINTWINNALHGQHHPLFVSENIRHLGEWDKRFNASITVISKEEPIFGSILAEIPSLGFSWGPQNYSDTPAIFIRNTQNEISMAFDFQWKAIFKKILPPIIPLETANTDLGVEAIHFFSTYQVNIFAQRIPTWLNEFAKTIEQAAFIFTKTTNKPKAIVQIRNTQYVTENLSKTFKQWLEDIWKGLITPKHRKSMTPQDKHEWIIDAQGNTLWEHISQKTILFTYDQHSGQKCQQVFELYKHHANDIHMARFDLQNNDHELLPNDAKPGFIFYFEDKTLKNILPCEQNNIEYIFSDI